MANDNQAGAKISGYLEKKGKLRMVSSWKKYWFVLEGRLLLYYRSKAEYEAISPCKGSITLGSPCNIKPALASTCIFQIETRSNTITLRAESRYEQDKWMQAILSALNQTSSNPTKMSHFRYSADDLVPTPTSDNKTKQKPVFSRQNTMPERLGKAPQQSKEIIQRLQTLGARSYGGSLGTINKLANKVSPKLPKNENLKRLIQSSEIVENNLYAQVDKRKEKKTEEVIVENSNYVRISAESVENEQYAMVRRKSEEGEIYSRESAEIYSETKRDSVESVEDEIYSSTKKHIYQEIIEEPVVVVENSEYCSIDTQKESSVDHNENNVVEEPVYSDSKIYDLPFGKRERPETSIYEVPEFEPDLPPRPRLEDETSSLSSNDQKPKKDGRLKKMARLVREGKKDNAKRLSFVVRMLNKIRKHDGREEEEVYVEETPPTSPKSNEDVQSEIQILSELQKLLDSKKNVIEEKIKLSTSSEDLRSEEHPYEEETRIEYAEVHEEREIIIPPILPPKQKYIEELMEYNKQLVNGNAMNIPRPKLRQKPKKHKRNSENVEEKLKTIDEILDDLDTEKEQTRQKVKDLIEKFNEHGVTDEVEMRKKSADSEYSSRHSDDLNRLLAELSKVTNAPILTPGVTTSLVNTPLTNEEWKNLVPIRKRRFSEPDYDIPRPHSSLQIIPSEEKCDNRMKPTRFFGPVLLDHRTNNSETNERNISITPDSLEVENVYQNTKRNCNSSAEEDRSLYSFTSHNYGKELGEMRTLDRRLTREEIYSRPKSLSSNTEASFDYKKEEYEDSLEPKELGTSAY